MRPLKEAAAARRRLLQRQDSPLRPCRGQPSAQTTPSEPVASAPALSLETVQGNWQRVVARMRAQSPQLQAVLRSAYPVGVAGEVVTLACDFGFHRDRLAEDKRREQVEQVLSDVLGSACRIEVVVDRDARARNQGVADADAPKDLFESADADAERRRELLNHPAVKDLTERGGQVRRVELEPRTPYGGLTMASKGKKRFGAPAGGPGQHDAPARRAAESKWRRLRHRWTRRP